MTDITRRMLMDCGFSPPNETFIKLDPRGSEYGFYEVTGVGIRLGNAQGLKVVKRDRNNEIEWSCLFDNVEHFKARARDNT